MDKLGRILMVEDDPKDVELSPERTRGIQPSPMKWLSPRDGEEALDYLYCRGKYKERSSDNPAVLLLDLKLPKVDGLEVLRQVKSDEKLKIIPVVVLTSSHEEKDMVLATNSASTPTWSSPSISMNSLMPSKNWVSSGP